MIDQSLSASSPSEFVVVFLVPNLLIEIYVTTHNKEHYCFDVISVDLPKKNRTITQYFFVAVLSNLSFKVIMFFRWLCSFYLKKRITMEISWMENLPRRLRCFDFIYKATIFILWLSNTMSRVLIDDFPDRPIGSSKLSCVGLKNSS